MIKKIILISIIIISGIVFAQDLPTMNAQELSKYNGKNGQKSYIAYKGQVYDVTDVKKWRNGKHEGNQAGTDITNNMKSSPHGEGIIKELGLEPIANYVK